MAPAPSSPCSKKPEGLISQAAEVIVVDHADDGPSADAGPRT
jgi:hypothetical protein